MARKSWARKGDDCDTTSWNASQRCQTVPQGAGRRDALLAHALWGLQFLSLAPLKKKSNPDHQLLGLMCWAQRQVISWVVVIRNVLGVMVMCWQCHSRGGMAPPLLLPMGCESLLCFDPTLHTAVLTLCRSHRDCYISLLLYVKTREVFKYLLSLETPEANVHLYKQLGFFLSNRQ